MVSLSDIAGTVADGFVKQPGSRGRRVDLDSKFQRKLWDKALEACLGDIDGTRMGFLGEWDSGFVRDMQTYTRERDAGERWNPTRKQFEYLRELARKLDDYG